MSDAVPVVSAETPLGSDNKTRWMKRVLIPFWVIRCLLMVLLLVVYIAAIVIIARNRDSFDDADIGKGSIAAVAVLVVLLALCLSLDIASMVMFGRHNLRPKTFLIFQIVETTIWLVILVISIVGSVGRGNSALGLLLLIILFAAFLALLIYASVIYHRTRKVARRGNYTPALNPASTAYEPAAGFAPSNPSLAPSNPFDNRYQASTASFEMRNEGQQHGAYQPSISPAPQAGYGAAAAPAPNQGYVSPPIGHRGSNSPPPQLGYSAPKPHAAAPAHPQAVEMDAHYTGRSELDAHHGSRYA
ncbi:hypothetical protein EJ08DRAFT_19356 [Tothia fuscella]|uniref:Uncharacterized protein n=1 Tax=Tothia fuscella TaxID=1048955 RepID=A0A9P4NYG6_9PEZI|nr:hypothetical protein EJ08DRAFT_19356 [Tothia fuscella]